MKKLIAQRPILYMGRTYERGDTIPAHDSKMVAAWLRARSAAWSGQESHQDAPGEGENGQGGGAPTMLTGHLDAAELEKWKKADLEKLAEAMGVDISKAKNNAERAAILAEEGVQAPATDPKNGGGVP